MFLGSINYIYYFMRKRGDNMKDSMQIIETIKNEINKIEGYR